MNSLTVNPYAIDSFTRLLILYVTYVEFNCARYGKLKEDVHSIENENCPCRNKSQLYENPSFSKMNLYKNIFVR